MKLTLRDIPAVTKIGKLNKNKRSLSFRSNVTSDIKISQIEFILNIIKFQQKDFQNKFVTLIK